MPNKLSRQPRLHGKIFCSPACGLDCTFAAFKEANEKANLLADELEDVLGGYWIPEVWENCGWNYKVVSRCGTLKVHPANDSYLAFLGPESLGGRWSEFGSTPCEAVNNVTQRAKREATEINEILERLNHAGILV